MSAAAGVSLSKQTMHRAHGPETETHVSGSVTFGSQNPSSQVRATLSVRPVHRGSRAYMGGLGGCQTLNFRCFTEGWRPRKCPSNLLYCCGKTGFPASICSDPAVGDGMCTTATIQVEVRTTGST